MEVEALQLDSLNDAFQEFVSEVEDSGLSLFLKEGSNPDLEEEIKRNRSTQLREDKKGLLASKQSKSDTFIRDSRQFSSARSEQLSQKSQLEQAKSEINSKITKEKTAGNDERIIAELQEDLADLNSQTAVIDEVIQELNEAEEQAINEHLEELASLDEDIDAIDQELEELDFVDSPNEALDDILFRAGFIEKPERRESESRRIPDLGQHDLFSLRGGKVVNVNDALVDLFSFFTKAGIENAAKDLDIQRVLNEDNFKLQQRRAENTLKGALAQAEGAYEAMWWRIGILIFEALLLAAAIALYVSSLGTNSSGFVKYAQENAKDTLLLFLLVLAFADSVFDLFGPNGLLSKALQKLGVDKDAALAVVMIIQVVIIVATIVLSLGGGAAAKGAEEGAKQTAKQGAKQAAIQAAKAAAQAAKQAVVQAARAASQLLKKGIGGVLKALGNAAKRVVSKLFTKVDDAEAARKAFRAAAVTASASQASNQLSQSIIEAIDRAVGLDAEVKAALSIALSLIIGIITGAAAGNAAAQAAKGAKSARSLAKISQFQSFVEGAQGVAGVVQAVRDTQVALEKAELEEEGSLIDVLQTQQQNRLQDHSKSAQEFNQVLAKVRAALVAAFDARAKAFSTARRTAV